MHPRGSALRWTARRNKSLGPGPVRRACPASGANFNVQVVRGKMTQRCLWHACKALSIGLMLMLLGTAMATIGYYADELSEGQEIRGNLTVRVKNESRGFHLNNLSYAGPIVMGVGGFIVVAACVMTFEARDSAAKVVPARFKMSATRQATRSGPGTRRSAASQTNRWEQHLGVFRSSPGGSSRGDRRALTAAFVHFSKGLGTVNTHSPSSIRNLQLTPSVTSRRASSMPRSGSVPNLSDARLASAPGMGGVSQGGGSPNPFHVSRPTTMSGRGISPRNTRRHGCALLNPMLLQRHALSVDETNYMSNRHSPDSLSGSQASMTLDLHNGEVGGSGGVTLKIRDRSRRSDTARRHVLSRQRPVEARDDPVSPRTTASRRSSNASDSSQLSRRRRRCSSQSGRASSVESRSSRGTLPPPTRSLNISIVEINEVNTETPEPLNISDRTQMEPPRNIEKANSCDSGTAQTSRRKYERNVGVSQSFSGKSTCKENFIKQITNVSIECDARYLESDEILEDSNIVMVHRASIETYTEDDSVNSNYFSSNLEPNSACDESLCSVEKYSMNVNIEMESVSKEDPPSNVDLANYEIETEPISQVESGANVSTNVDIEMETIATVKSSTTIDTNLLMEDIETIEIDSSIGHQPAC